jgi:hypothetical protein
MRWKDLQHVPEGTFKRLVGVKLSTYKKMVEEAQRLSPPSRHKIPGKKRGPKPALGKEDEVLMLLMYYREYRTFLHISMTYQISESQCWRIITGLEKLLIKSELFHLPGKKTLQQAHTQWEVVVVDVSEHPIERPKKNSGTITQEKRKSIH